MTNTSKNTGTMCTNIQQNPYNKYLKGKKNIQSWNFQVRIGGDNQKIKGPFDS